MQSMSRFISVISERLIAVGLVWGVLALTVAAMLVSVSFSFSINMLKDELYPVADWLFPSAIVPAVVTPIVASVILNLVHKLEDARRSLEIAATTDPLTGAANRRHLLENIGRRGTEHRRSIDGYSILLIDVDHFKAINDTFGHALGDAVLVSISAACRSITRRGDIFCRWGGEEFLLLLAGTEASSALNIAETLRSRIAALTVAEIGRSVTVSIGVASSLEGTADFHEVVRRADEQMYLAKLEGRNCVMPARTAAEFTGADRERRQAA